MQTPKKRIAQLNNNSLPNIKQVLQKRLLSLYDVQELFNVSRTTIYNWCKKGLLTYSKVSSKMYFDADEINRMLDERKQTMVPGSRGKN